MFETLKKFFIKKKKTYDPEQVQGFKPTFIFPDADLVHEALAISEERRVEIANNMERNMEKIRNLPYAMEEILKDIKHPNELFYLAMIVGTWYANKEKELKIKKMLGGFLGKNGE